MPQNISIKLAATEAVIHRLALLCRPLLGVAIAVCSAALSPLIMLFILGGLMWCFLDRQRSSSVSHGSARWASVWDLFAGDCLFQESGLSLGRAVAPEPASRWREWWCLLTLPLTRSREAVGIASAREKHPILPLHLPDRIPHCAVYGASGSGKSTSFAIPFLLSDGPGSMVVLDPKGELTRLTAAERQRRFGDEIIIIDPYGLTEGCGINRSTMNPLALYLNDERRIVDNARRLADALVVRTGRETDQFWPNISITTLTAVIAFLMAHARPEEANLSRARDLLTNPELLEQMLQRMVESEKCGGMLGRPAGQLLQLAGAGQTRASALAVTNSHCDFLDSHDISETLAFSSFNPRDLVRRRMSIYLVFPVERLASLQGLQRILISTFINVVFEAGEDRNRRVQFLLDEAATLGPMESLYSATQFGRSYGLRMCYLFQSTSQLEKVFPESQAADVNGTVARVFAGTNDLKTAKDVSDWMGSSTILTRNDQSSTNDGTTVGHGIQDFNQSHNRGTSTSTTLNEAGRALLRAEEILQLPSHLAIALLPGLPPILTEKVPYWMKQRRRSLSRLCGTVTDLLLIAFTAAVVTVLVWVCCAGPDHPLIREFREELHFGMAATQGRSPA